MDEEKYKVEKEDKSVKTEGPAADVVSGSEESGREESETRVFSDSSLSQAPEIPGRYQQGSSQIYRQNSQETPRVYYHQPVMPAYDNQIRADRECKSRSVPGLTGFAFSASLLSLFLLPFLRDYFPVFLEAYADPITYDRDTYLFYFVLVLVYGGLSLMLSILSLIFAPIGISKAKRNNLDGAALGTAAMLIAVVSVIMLMVSTSISLYINNIL